MTQEKHNQCIMTTSIQQIHVSAICSDLKVQTVCHTTTKLNVSGIWPHFPTIFTMENNFRDFTLASLADTTITLCLYFLLLQERICF